jgi:predicted  nucleic acid-binding Zn-ribbon protein
MQKDWNSQSVEDKLIDIMDGIQKNTDLITETEHRISNIEATIEDMEKLLKKSIRELSDLQAAVKRSR